jgi:taurine dioxygenase
MDLKIRKLSYPLGAEIIGLDIREPLAAPALQAVRRAFLDYCLLLFRGTALSPAQYVAFSRHFGNPDAGRKTRDPDYPEINRIINQPRPDGGAVASHYAGSDWHSDASFRVAPTPITMLHAIEVPDVGGDTQFANMYLAYETLSDGMKKLIDKLEGVHIQEEKLLDHSSPEHLRESRRSMTIAHPLVAVHPETGRKSLYIGDKVQMFAGMTPDESRPLIDFLCAHSNRPQFSYSHHWQKNDLVIWDDRCTNHMASGNYDRRNQVRHMAKISLLGPKTGYVYEDVTETRNLSRSFTYA